MASTPTENKQQFLRQQIIEKGYDTDLFTAFYSHKTNDRDLEDISFQQIKNIVDEFRERFRPGQTLQQVQEAKRKQEENQSDHQNPQLQEQKHQDLSENRQEFQQQSPQNKTKKFSQKKENQVLLPQSKSILQSEIYEIPCQRIVQTPLSKVSNIQISVSDPQLVHGGLFSKSYVNFKVTTMPINWEVKRRFTQFKWLRDILVLCFPGVYVPPLTPKISRGNSKMDQAIKKQKFLYQFINGVSRNPLLCQSQQFLAFLKQKNPGVFSKYQDACKKIRKHQNLNSLLSTEGSIQCSLEEKNIVVQQINDFVAQSEVLRKKLKRNSNGLMDGIKQLSSAFDSYTENLNQLKKLQAGFGANPQNERFYENLATAFQSLSEYEWAKVDGIKEYFNLHFKYGYTEMDALKSLLKERENLYNNYRKAELKGKTSQNIRNWYGYFNKQVVTETQRLAWDNFRESCTHFMKLAKHQLEQSINLHQIWDTLQSNMRDIKET